MLSPEVLLVFPLGYFLFSHFFPCHTAQLVCIDFVQLWQQVFDPLVANGTHSPHVNFRSDQDIVEDNPFKLGFLVIELQRKVIFFLYITHSILYTLY